jgi:hypothetical protein
MSDRDVDKILEGIAGFIKKELTEAVNTVSDRCRP